MNFKDTFFSYKPSLNCKGRLVSFNHPLVMGILNITPDSFYPSSRKTHTGSILKQAGKMIEEGASILDVGAVSTRPGSEGISRELELRRLAPALEVIRKHYPGALVSVDTFRAGVARRMVRDYEVDMINDISGGQRDREMFAAVAELQVPYILMHMKGTPENMQRHTRYENLLKEIIKYFTAGIGKLKGLGVNDIIIDPGFGFAKTIEQNYELLGMLDAFHILECPLMVGLSRKSMIYKKLGTNPSGALNGSTVLHTVAVLKGANILRVHDVREAVETIKLLENLKSA